MKVTNETIAREVRLMSHELLCDVVESDRRCWRGYKVAARAELVRRSTLGR